MSKMIAEQYIRMIRFATRMSVSYVQLYSSVPFVRFDMPEGFVADDGRRVAAISWSGEVALEAINIWSTQRLLTVKIPTDIVEKINATQDPQ